MSRPVPSRLRGLLLTFALLPGLASAVADFNGLGFTALSLIGVDGAQTLPTGVTIEYQALLEDQRAEATGRGAEAASNWTLVPMEIGDMPFDEPLLQAQAIDGWAGDGVADTRLLSRGLVFLTNGSSVPVTFNFAYSILAEVGASADPFGIEARADVVWLIDDLLGAMTPITQAVYADPQTGDQQLDRSGTFGLTLPAGGTTTLSALLDTWGTAEAPEPPVWALLAAGLGAAWVRRSERLSRHRR